jgi:hypothetical protein
LSHLGPLYTKKGGYGRHGRRARGRQFSLYRAISPIIDAI